MFFLSQLKLKKFQIHHQTVKDQLCVYAIHSNLNLQSCINEVDWCISGYQKKKSNSNYQAHHY